MPSKTPGQRLDDVLASAQQEYDEAKLRIHLANMEVKEEWDKLESRWLEFCDKCQRADTAAKESESNVDEALHAVGHELHRAFENIKRACS